MTDELKQWKYDKGYTIGYSDGRASLIEELEKIKEELNIQGLGRCDGKIFNNEYNRIIDKHIFELKGENK